MKLNIFEQYAKAVAKQFHITLDEMFSGDRRRDYVDARQMLYFLCMERPIRLNYIVRFMKEAGCEVYHTTILHGYKKAKEQIDSDPDYKAVVEKIKDLGVNV
tara:strand:+ start:80 stop:385 length:306 start_codon:yes stop_codon:yes gene_type:complete